MLSARLFDAVVFEGEMYRTVNEGVASVRPDGLDKARCALAVVVEDRGQRLFALNLDLAVSPAWNLDNSVDDLGIILVWVERDLQIS
jgi:hypothetical protein